VSQVRALDRDDYNTIVELLSKPTDADPDFDFDRPDAADDFALDLDGEK
jgi:hypothetical protein